MNKKFIGAVVIFLIVALVLTFMNSNSSSGSKKVLFETSKGNIVIELYSEMPITAGNFEELVSSGFYDGVKFHRVIPGFVIQGGDPLSKDNSKKAYWGTGGPGYTIKDEFTNSALDKNDRGTISMANAGPNTGGSQFFINLVDNEFLNGKHPVFGKVVEGMDVVDEIANIETNANDMPVEDVVIIKASIVK